MTRWVPAVVVTLTVAVGCGANDSGKRASSTPKPPGAAGQLGGGSGRPGRLVEIGGGRSLFLHCVGSGSPTVVLEAGAASNAMQWQEVQSELGRTTRACAYDRAGIGNSVAPPGVRDARDEIADLRLLLDRLRIDPPYVLVGHSYGGVLARVFAHQNPADVGGLVLIDTMGRDGRQRQLAIWPETQAREVRSELARAVIGGVDLAVGEALASRVRTLTDTPLAVIAAGQQDNFPRSPARLACNLRRLWDRMQDELAALSDNSVHVIALRSDHDVPSPQTGQPSVVIRAVQAVVRAAREHTRLPQCRNLFSAPDVRCRS
jgi:pimeloyl-ACP methyl ester carboxylesterase